MNTHSLDTTTIPADSELVVGKVYNHVYPLAARVSNKRCKEKRGCKGGQGITKPAAINLLWSDSLNNLTAPISVSERANMKQ